MKNSFRHLVVGAFALICFASCEAIAQTEQEKLTAVILEKDSRFWTAYNTCDTEKFRSFFTDDVEFYHDKGGVTLGIDALTESVKKNLCGTNNFRLRREPVAGTIKVFPLRKGNEIYGAIMSGEHVFYVTENGKPEFLDGRANFTHLWLIRNGDYKMARVLSFDHRPASPPK
jgi:hypothetical protein